MNRRQTPENLVIYEVTGEWSGHEPPGPEQGFLGYWVESGYTFFFFDRPADMAMETLMNKDAGLELRYVHKMKYHQWQDGAGFKPFHVGPLTIAPPWEDIPPGENTVIIDPGLAFGFGGHPTTKACLEALARIYKEDAPEKVLDLGAGTGVLSIAAIRLGAQQATAVEYSHLAAETARDNAALNTLAGQIQVIHDPAEKHCTQPADLVCSNLHHQVQQAIFQNQGFHHRKWLVLSGLFHQQGQDIENKLQNIGYQTIDRKRDERWTTLTMYHPPRPKP